MMPLRLGPNPVRRPFRPGGLLAEFRGVEPSDQAPEDWVGSTTVAYGARSEGLTTLHGGGTLREAVMADPAMFLGPEHVARHGADPALLVKLLDAGARLAVHYHPDRDFARQHLACPYGKTEAWVIVAARGADPVVYLGFKEAVPAELLSRWVEHQDTAGMLAALNRIPVRAGDTVLVPAGVPHAVGGGVFMVELQEPTDFSLFLEQPPGGPRAGDHLGLPLGAALACVDRRAWTPASLERLLSCRGQLRPGVEQLFPAEADPFFRAERLDSDSGVTLDPGFSVLVALEGAGSLDTDGGRLQVRRGDTVLVPFGAGPGRLEGRLRAIRCLPAIA